MLPLKPSIAQGLVIGLSLVIGGVTTSLAAFGSRRLESPIQDIPAGLARREDVNERFRVLDERTRQLDERLDETNTIGSTRTGAVAHIAAVVCGVSEPISLPATASIPNLGVVSGYRAVKRICEETCGSPTARICTGNDIILSAQLGHVPLDGNGFPQTVTGAIGGGSSWSGRSPECRGWLGDAAPAVANRYPSSNAAEFRGGNVEIVDSSAMCGTLGAVCCD